MITYEDLKTYVDNAIQQYAPVDEYAQYAEEYAKNLHQHLSQWYFECSEQDLLDIEDSDVELVVGKKYYQHPRFDRICVSNDFVFERNTNLELLKQSSFDSKKMYNFLLSNFLWTHLE